MWEGDESLRLEPFSIHNRFGSVDSNEIDLSHEGNLNYFLDRNSAGKTSVLRALSYLEVEEIPQQDPKFANYKLPAGSFSTLEAFENVLDFCESNIRFRSQ